MVTVKNRDNLHLWLWRTKTVTDHSPLVMAALGYGSAWLWRTRAFLLYAVLQQNCILSAQFVCSKRYGGRYGGEVVPQRAQIMRANGVTVMAPQQSPMMYRRAQSFVCQIVFSCLVLFCCNPLFGFIAFILASQYT